MNGRTVYKAVRAGLGIESSFRKEFTVRRSHRPMFASARSKGHLPSTITLSAARDIA